MASKAFPINNLEGHKKDQAFIIIIIILRPTMWAEASCVTSKTQLHASGAMGFPCQMSIPLWMVGMRDRLLYHYFRGSKIKKTRSRPRELEIIVCILFGE